MSTEQAIEDLVERFVDDISDLVRRVQNESLAIALRAIESGRPVQLRLPGLGEARAKKKTSETKQRGRKATREAGPASRRGESAQAELRAEPAAQQTNGQSNGAATARERLRGRKLHIERRTDAAVPPAPASDPATREEAPSSDRSQTSAEREAMVLDAVRFLVRGTAAQIAQRCGLPNGTVYVVLRALVTSGKVAKTETASGLQYGLVSTGGIRPFKRVSSGASVPPPASAAEEPSAAEPVEEKHTNGMTNGAGSPSDMGETLRWIDPA